MSTTGSNDPTTRTFPSGDRSLVTTILSEIFAAIGCGAVLSNAERRVVHLNRHALPRLGESLSLTPQGHLIALDRDADALLQAGLKRCLQPEREEGARDALGLRRADRRPLIERMVSIGGEARTALDGAALLVILIDLEGDSAPSASLLQQVFGLTPSEARLARRIIGGESSAEIAEQTGMALGTVRCQMRALFASTRTSRQGELIALLTRLAVISELGKCSPQTSEEAGASCATR